VIDTVQPGKTDSRLLRHWIRPVLIAAGILACCAIWSLWYFGGVLYGLHYLRGEQIVVLSPVVDLGTLPAEKTARADFVIKNLTRNSVTIYGAEVDCSCVVPIGLPLTIGPFAEGSLQLNITPSQSIRGQGFLHQAVLHLSLDHPQVTLTIQGNVSE